MVWIYRVALALLLLTYTGGVLVYSGRYMDDAYITYRFAKNLAEGHGIVWNIGEPPIEGYSNPLWMLITAAFHLPPFSFFSIENVTFYFAAVVIGFVLIHLYRHATCRLAVPPALALIGICFFLLDRYFWESMFNGLETFLQLAILYFAIVVATQEVSGRNILWLSILAMLLVLNRFEGFLFAIPLAAGYGIVNRKRERGHPFSAWVPFTVTIGFVGALTLFRYFYFGEIVPLSVEAKSGGKVEGIESVWHLLHNPNGWDYVARFFNTTSLIWLVPFIPLLLLSRMSRELATLLAGVVVLFGGAVAIVVQNGGDWMPGFRLLAPFAPLLVLLLFYWINDGCRLERRGVLQLVFLGLFAWSAWAGLFWMGDLRQIRLDRTYFEQTGKSIGRYWEDLLPSDAYYVTARAGSISYGAGQMKVLDFHGLVYPAVGRAEGKQGKMYGKRKWECMFEDEFLVYYVNTATFVKAFREQAGRFGRQFDVALRSGDVVFSSGKEVTFVRRDWCERLQRKDPELEIISFAEYQEMNPEHFGRRGK